MFRVLTLATFVAALLLPANAAQAASLPRPAHAWAGSVTPNTATVRWTPARGAVQYELMLGGRLLLRTSNTAVRVHDLTPSSLHTFTVRAIAGANNASIPSDPIPVTTLPPRTCTRYVSTAGSDAGAGTAQAPWRTIGHLIDRWQPGDVGCLTGQFAEDVSIFRGGTAAAPVVLRSAPGVTAGIRGRVWIAKGADHVVVAHLALDGRAIDDTARNSLPSPTVNGNSARLIANDIHNARSRVCVVLGSVHGYGTTSDTVLAYNRIHDCGQRSGPNGTTTVNTHHGIYVESARRLRIVDNVIVNNADRGIQLYPDARGSLIMGNLIDGNGEGIIFSGAQGYSSSGNRVLRNVIANSRIRSNIEHYWEAPSRPGTGNVAARNCLGGAREGNVATPTVGYAARGNVTGVLRYRNRARGDYRLAAGSGCAAYLRAGALPLRPR